MSVPGFDPRYIDFPDYIIGITKEIWEERNISTLHQYYSDDIIVRTPGSITVGIKGVLAATMATLAEFPDRTLLGEDVIWSGNEQSGFLSSHRILSTATHRYDGMYGKGTGKKLTYRIIADCAAKENTIYREDPMMPPRAAVRWSLHGKHEGWGMFGTPTQADAYVLGISHAEFGPWGLRREYTLIDETAILKQLVLHNG